VPSDAGPEGPACRDNQDPTVFTPRAGALAPARGGSIEKRGSRTRTPPRAGIVMTLRKALVVVTSLFLKGRWRDAHTIGVPLILACFFSLTGLADDTIPGGAGVKD